jgi:hypothetical protein
MVHVTFLQWWIAELECIKQQAANGSETHSHGNLPAAAGASENFGSAMLLVAVYNEQMKEGYTIRHPIVREMVVHACAQ